MEINEHNLVGILLLILGGVGMYLFAKLGLKFIKFLEEREKDKKL